MTLAMFLILFGLMIMYAGIKGLSIRELLQGKHKASTVPAPVTRGATGP